ncbi:MAG: hypothetical protein Q7N50_15510, partial [Armatimonadota bacterium]|nr:hypothetical protein [Armatimonadota bacterium]
MNRLAVVNLECGDHLCFGLFFEAEADRSSLIDRDIMSRSQFPGHLVRLLLKDIRPVFRHFNTETFVPLVALLLRDEKRVPKD